MDIDPGVSYRPHYLLESGLAPGTVIGASASASEIVPVAGAEKVKVRAKVSAAATLALRIMRAPPNSETEYAANQLADVSLSADTEDEIEITDLAGEAYVKVLITAGGAQSVVDYVEVSQL